MGMTAEVVAKRYEISREAQDEYAFESQIRTAAAQQSGGYDDEIIPMDTKMLLTNKETGESKEIDYTVNKDECNRPETTLEGLASLKPVFDPENGSVTAGNSSQLSDGASVTLVMSEDKAKELNLKPLAYFRGFTTMGCEPDEMGIGPIYSVPKLLKNYNLSVDDIDIWELNEAFAVQVVYCRDKLGIPMDKLNLDGGSISIGHPFGMTGSRQVGHLARQLQNLDKQFGVVTMCVGGGMGASGLFEKIPFLISESSILNCFQHLVDFDRDDLVIVGSGDDAAVIKSQEKDLVHSIDISKVNSHFPSDSMPKDIAYRSLQLHLSDLAAMGAYPAFISIGLTSNITDLKWYKQFTEGVEKILNEYQLKLVGGDVTNGEISVCVNVFGYAYEKNILRSTAKVGDLIYITGSSRRG